MNARLLTLGRLRHRLAKRPPAAPPRGPARCRALLAVTTASVVFVALQAALSGASAVTHLVADPPYADKVRRIGRLERAAPDGAPRVILLGTSRTGYGFAAGRVQSAAADAGTPAVVFNFGIPAAGPITHLVYLRRLLSDGHRPDFLLLEVLPPLLAEMPGGPYEGRLLKGDILTRDEIDVVARYAVPRDPLRERWRAAALSPVHEHRFKLLGRVFPSALPWQLRYDWARAPDPNGWNVSFAESVSDDRRARETAAAVAEYRDVVRRDLPAGPTVAALRDTLALCRAERIPVALVLCPEATTFRAIYPSHVEPKLAGFLAGLTAEFGCPVADARGWVADDQFIDGHHLLRSGAATFTDRLGAEVVLPFLRARTPRGVP